MKNSQITPFVKSRLEAYELGEINILLGEDAADNLNFSLMQTAMLIASRKFKRIVYFNFPFSRRRFTEARDTLFGEHCQQIDKMIEYYHPVTGRMAEKLHALKASLDDPEHTAIVINSWELTCSSYRYKEELVFALRELQMELGVTVIVFGVVAKPSAIRARRLNRAGFGKLSLAADTITSLIEEKESEVVTDAYSTTDSVETRHGASLPRSENKKKLEPKKKDDLDERIEANRRKTLAELPTIKEEAKRTGILRMTVDQILGLEEDEYESLKEEFGKIETIRKPKKRESVNLSVPNFNDLDDANGHLSEIEEELEYA